MRWQDVRDILFEAINYPTNGKNNFKLVAILYFIMLNENFMEEVYSEFEEDSETHIKLNLCKQLSCLEAAIAGEYDIVVFLSNLLDLDEPSMIDFRDYCKEEYEEIRILNNDFTFLSLNLFSLYKIAISYTPKQDNSKNHLQIIKFLIDNINLTQKILENLLQDIVDDSQNIDAAIIVAYIGLKKIEDQNNSVYDIEDEVIKLVNKSINKSIELDNSLSNKIINSLKNIFGEINKLKEGKDGMINIIRDQSRNEVMEEVLEFNFSEVGVINIIKDYVNRFDYLINLIKEETKEEKKEVLINEETILEEKDNFIKRRAEVRTTSPISSISSPDSRLLVTTPINQPESNCL